MKGRNMETPYDWLTVAIFAGLIVIFLQRSVGEGEPTDSIWSYFPPSIGCAVANQLGNHAVKNGALIFHVAAIAVVAAVLTYIFKVIKPFPVGHP
jgi:hypothetical protein